MLSLDKETASRILRLVDQEVVEEISREIASLEDLDVAVRDEVIEEFYNMALARQFATDGGLSYARSLLEKSLNKDDASRIIEIFKEADEQFS